MAVGITTHIHQPLSACSCVLVSETQIKFVCYFPYRNSCADAPALPSFWLPWRGIVVLPRIAVSHFTLFTPYPLTFQTTSSAPGYLWQPCKFPEDHCSQEMHKDNSLPSLNRKKPTQSPNSHNLNHLNSTLSSASSLPSTACLLWICPYPSLLSTLLKQHIMACPTTTHPTHCRASHLYLAAFPCL